MRLFICSAAFLTSFTAALPSNARSSAPNSIVHGITNSSDTVKDQTFDYVICGGGLTGLTVASRLTENPDINVLVIENGFDNHADPRVNDVRTYGAAFESDLEYSIRSTPVPWQDGKQLLLVAGKMLGGSDGLNGASWTKGPKSQYDLLPVLTGDESWGWEGLNEYMLKAENFHIPSDEEVRKGAQYIPEYHGEGGPIQVAFGAGMYGGTQLSALEASEHVWNLTRNPDAASGRASGTVVIPNMVHDDYNQNRSSAFTGYAQQQVQERDNFVILTGHRVTRIVWSKNKSADGKLVASGVTFQSSRDTPVEFVGAKRELLLAAGSLQSPQILELSGVGDPDVLQAAGVEVKLPLLGVGRNMQEQTKNTLVFAAQPNTSFFGTGPPSAMSFPTLPQILGSKTSTWYETVTQNISSHVERLQTKNLVSSNNTATQTILQAQIDNLFHEPDASAAEIFFTIDLFTNTIGVDAWQLIPLSRGTAHIHTNSSWDHPVVEPSYFLHGLDLHIQTAINAQSRAVFATPPLDQFVLHETVPGLHRVPENASEDVWEQWTKETFTSVWHYIATLAMMKEELGGVVDSRLRVYGLGNVRVVDASVLPVQLSAHLSSSLFGIAEKAARMIKEDQR